MIKKYFVTPMVLFLGAVIVTSAFADEAVTVPTDAELELARDEVLVAKLDLKITEILHNAEPELLSKKDEELFNFKTKLYEDIAKLIEVARKKYEESVRKFPEDFDLQFSYTQFVDEYIGEAESIELYEKIRERHPKHEESWSRLAEIYGHIGPVEKSFPYYEESLRLNPDDPYEWYNFGTLVFLFRPDAMVYFKITEQEVFEKAFQLYEKARVLEPNNFELASLIAQSYYGVKTADETKNAEKALEYWTSLITIASNDAQKSSIYLHLARWNIKLKRYKEAKALLEKVTDENDKVLKSKLERNLAEFLAEEK